MQPFKKLIYGLRNEDTMVLTRFCFVGLWSVYDVEHPFGGNVTYIDQYGEQQNVNMIFDQYETSIMAVSIVSSNGVESIVCDSGLPGPLFYPYMISELTSNNPATVCSWPLNNLTLQIYSNSPVLEVGIRFYDDQTLLIPYTGNNLMQLVVESSIPKRVRISSTGYITEIVNC